MHHKAGVAYTLQHLGGAVLGPVVHHDELKVAHRLAKDAADGQRHVPLAVADSEKHGDEGCRGRAHAP